MKDRRIVFKLHTGSWKGDDVDITPTLKLCTDSKINESGTVKITLTYIALCWLKWALIVSVSTQKETI